MTEGIVAHATTIVTPSEPTLTSTAPPAEPRAIPVATELASNSETLPKPTPAAVVSEGTLAPVPTSISAPSTDDTKVPIGVEVTEPQNTLTRQFTEREWAALKEFRVRSTQ